MSGFLPDLASWALGGGAGRNDGDDENGRTVNSNASGEDDANKEGANEGNQQALSKDEIRMKRLANLVNSIQVEPDTN